MRLRYTRPALADLADILDYVGKRSPKGAAKVQSRIKVLTELLIDFPNAGAPTNDPAIRRLVVTPYSYHIFYEATNEDVIIHAVRHGARNPDEMPGA